MEKEQIIEDMGKIACREPMERWGYTIKECKTCAWLIDKKRCSFLEFSERLYNEGYRKESDTAKEIFNRLWYLFKTESCASTIKEMAESYGVDLK